MLFIILIILFSFLLVIFIGQRQELKQIESEEAQLRDLTVDLSENFYCKEQLQDIPEPVQRYFNHVLKEGQPYISSVYIQHDGQFKTALDKEWINIEGEQFFSANEPGFLWIGKTALFTVRDMYISGKGQIKVSLLHLMKVVEGSGPQYDQGELLRWLGESIWFPTNLLPNSLLQWSPIDENTAKLSFHFKEQNINYKVSFNSEGEIIQMETQRYMGDDNLETWIGRVSCYEEHNGIKVPMVIEAIWKLSDGEHSYAKFNIRKIHHN